MKKVMPYIRIFLYLVVSFFLLELFADAGSQWAVEKYPILWLVLISILFISIVMEVILASIKRVLFKTMETEEQERYLALGEAREEAVFGWFKRTYAKMLDSKPMEKEEEIVLDHEFDGIRELDNNLPPWWVYLFYATIIFAVVYLLRYQVFGGPTQIDEYNREVAAARIALEEYRKHNKDLVDASTVELLTDPADLAAGKAIYTANCVACHKESGGGGIGPNLTDDYWILGGGIKNVFETISEGGRPGKGMVAWKTDLSPSEIAQVSSYVISLHGTNPDDGKEPEGELWTPDEES